MAKPSQAGPFLIGLDNDLTGSEVRTFDFNSIEGPTGKTGGLQKFYGSKGGLDYIYVTNTSNELVMVRPSGGQSVPVAPATSINLEGSAQTRVIVSNQSSNTIDADDVNINVGNNEREGDKPVSFSSRQLVTDLIPGAGNG